MARRDTQQGTLFAAPPDELAALHGFLVPALGAQGFPDADAEAVATEVLGRVGADPTRYAARLAALEEHRRWFLALAMRVYRDLLQAERRGRRRAMLAWLSALEAVGDVGLDPPDVDTVMALADRAGLTARQRACLEAMLIRQMLVVEIAELNGTSATEMRTLLRRGGARMRRHLLRHSA
jgi:DNA-directed RNA polymerase specialized sigma24 family protein